MPGNAKSRRRILLADDHAYIPEALKTYVEDRLSDRLEVVAVCRDGEEALAQAKKLKPDLALVDVHMPRLRGPELIPRLKRALPEVIVLVLSAFDDRAHVLEAVRAGADDYLFKKNATPAGVARHILQAFDKALPAQGEVHQHVVEALRDRPAAAPAPELTGTELEILRLAAHRGASAKDIVQELGGRITARTVGSHWQHIYEKLGVQSQPQAALMAVKLGLISAEDVEPAGN